MTTELTNIELEGSIHLRLAPVFTTSPLATTFLLETPTLFVNSLTCLACSVDNIGWSVAT